MRIGRRAVVTAAVAAIALSGIGAASALQDSPSTGTSPIASGAEAADDPVPDPDVGDEVTTPTSLSEDGEVSGGEEVEPDVDVLAPTVVDPAPDGAAVERRLEAELSQEFGSTATGVVSAELAGGSIWRLAVEVEGAVPNLVHNVLVQHRTEDGRFSQIAPVCEGTSDADGSFSCSAWLEFDESTEPALISVMGYDPRSNGYRLIGSGELSAS